MALAIEVSLIALCFTSITVHSAGIYLILFSLKFNSLVQNIQRKYLLSLTVCEVIFNIFELAKCILWMVNAKISYLTQMSAGSVFLLYILTIYICIDRIIVSVQKESYPFYWRGANAAILLLFSWTTCICISIILTLSEEYVGMRTTKILLYSLEGVGICALIIGIISFIYTIRHMLGNNEQCDSGDDQSGCCFKKLRIFWRNRVDASFLIIISFMFLMVIPRMVEVWVKIYNKANYDVTNLYYSISYQSMTLLHGVIYILVHCPFVQLPNQISKAVPVEL